MIEEEFIITGGFFDGSSKGYIGKIDLLKRDNSVSLSFSVSLISEPPSEALRVINKGFSGASIFNDMLWVCSSNQVLAYTLYNFKLVNVIDDPLFNDLHYVLAEKEGLYVVNTGLESLDFFGYDGELKERTLLTSDKRTLCKTSDLLEDFRLLDSKPHFMHVNYCSRNLNGNMMLTFVRQRRIVEMEKWGWASPEYESSPHEGFIADFSVNQKPCLWVSLVPGQIIASDVITGEIVSKWNLVDLNIPPGWTRGLCVLEHGLLVGVTKIRKSTAGYYSGWEQKDIDASRTTISYIPFDETGDVVTIDVLNENNAKIFSILPISL